MVPCHHSHAGQDHQSVSLSHLIFQKEAYSSLLNSHLLSSIVSAMLGQQDRGPRFEEASGAARLAYRGPQPHDHLYQNLVPYHYDGAQVPSCALANRCWKPVIFGWTLIFQAPLQPVPVPAGQLLPGGYNQVIEVEWSNTEVVHRGYCDGELITC